MAVLRELRRRVAELEALASNRAGLDLSKLGAHQRARYDEHMSANRVGTYDGLMDRVCDGPQLDSDIARVLYGAKWQITVEDSERIAADKYYNFKELFL